LVVLPTERKKEKSKKRKKRAAKNLKNFILSPSNPFRINSGEGFVLNMAKGNLEGRTFFR
jgi:hypothetical protein